MAFGGFIAMASLAVQTVVVLGFVMASGKLGDTRAIENLAYDGSVLSTATLAGLPVIVALCVVFAAIRPGMRAVDYLALRPANWKPTVLGILAIIGVGLLYGMLSSWAGRPELPEFMVKTWHSAGFMPLLWLAVVVAAPIGEEFFFRGFLFAGIAKSRLGGWGAVVFTSLTWAVIHMQYDLWDISYIFILGLLIGTFRLKTRSLWPPVLMHFVVNLVAMIETAIRLG